MTPPSEQPIPTEPWVWTDRDQQWQDAYYARAQFNGRTGGWLNGTWERTLAYFNVPVTPKEKP